jgi:hypothetical protein
MEFQGFVAIVVALAEMVYCINYQHVGLTSIA